MPCITLIGDKYLSKKDKFLCCNWMRKQQKSSGVKSFVQSTQGLKPYMGQ